MNYKIEVSMTPAYHDCPNAPYFWCILGRKEGEQDWFNCGHGWAVTPEEAWSLAYDNYIERMNKQLKEQSELIHKLKQEVEDKETEVQKLLSMIDNLKDGLYESTHSNQPQYYYGGK